MARILLADDDKGALDLVRRALEMDGHQVTMAEDGNEALVVFAATPVDVLVADVEMPGIDGVELARRALAERPDLRLVMISGSEQLLDKARPFMGSGARLVSKPFSIDEIRSAVRAVLGS